MKPRTGGPPPSGSGGGGSPFWWHDTLRAGDAEVHIAFTSVAAGSLADSPSDAEPAWAGGRADGSIVALERTMAVPRGELRLLRQVHSAEVRDASLPPRTEPPMGDAWISPHGAEPLAVRVADCMPVMMLGDRADGGIVTAGAHAGRPGLLAGVLENTVAAVRAAGAERVTAWIGPSACGRCYEIPAQMVESIAADRPAIRSTTSWGTAALDLRAEAGVVLAAAGAEVVDVGGCTMEDQTLFSHRRSQARGTREGRLAGLVWTCR